MLVSPISQLMSIEISDILSRIIKVSAGYQLPAFPHLHHFLQNTIIMIFADQIHISPNLSLDFRGVRSRPGMKARWGCWGNTAVPDKNCPTWDTGFDSYRDDLLANCRNKTACQARWYGSSLTGHWFLPIRELPPGDDPSGNHSIQ